MDEEGDRGAVVCSPFGRSVISISMEEGSLDWSLTLLERVPYPVLALADGVVIQGEQGTLWAVDDADGEIQWELASTDPLDFPMGPLRFRDGAFFSISRRGLIRRVVATGDSTVTYSRPLDWGTRRAEIVPFRSVGRELAYLDQAGRLTVHAPDTLEILETRMLEPDRRADVLSGWLSPTRQAWFVELPAALRASGETFWRQPLGEVEQLWSEEGQLLAVPLPLEREGRFGVLLATRGEARLFDGGSGSLLTALELPSEAVAAPIQDQEGSNRWLLCRNHLVLLTPESEWRVYPLPMVDVPFSLQVVGDRAVIGSVDGRIFALEVGGAALGPSF